ncbi:MAG: zinc-binding dehydrogenase [Acidimicrobiales bacterium]
MKAIRQYEFGGPEQLRYEEIADPEPGDRQVRIAVDVAGVHFVDTTIRRGVSFGAFPSPALPMIPGREVAGTVDRLGPDADASLLGHRVVVHLGMASGGYASAAVADADTLFPLPEGVDAAEAVAMVGTGRTTLGILEVARPRPDDVVLVTAAAGGVGALLVQAARATGAFVVAAARGANKVAVAERLGADVTIDYAAGRWAPEPWTDRVREALAGRPVTLALDGVGGEIGRAAFDLVAPGGRMVVFGYASGTQLPLDADDLYSSGVTVAAGIGARIMSRPGGIRDLSAKALDELTAGRLKPLVNAPFALADAAEAHRAIEARETIGKVVLVP